MTNYVFPFLLNLAQLFFLLLVAPFLTDLERGTQALLSGRRGISAGHRWKQIRNGWQQGRPVPVLSWLSLCLVILALAGLPVARAGSLLDFLSEPLACGILLIISSVPVWILALNNPPTRALRFLGQQELGKITRDLLLLVPVLALTGSLITVGLPGAGTFIGVLQQRLLQPAPTLLGGLAFIAGAMLLILTRHFLSDGWNERLIAASAYRHRGLLRYRHDLAACCWILLIADLAWPDSLASTPSSAARQIFLWSIVAPLKLTGVMLIAVLWRSIRPISSERFAIVLAGGAILLVLAGRLSL